MDIEDLVEAPHQAFEFTVDIALEGLRDVDVVARQVDLHGSTPEVSEGGAGGFSAAGTESRTSAIPCADAARFEDSHQPRRLRSLEDGTPILSRYLAIVRRAIRMPCPARTVAILLSLSGWRGFSATTSLRIWARTAVEERSSPLPVLTWLEKKYLNSNVPRGVSMYFLVVTRETVDSCNPSASATSRSTMGFIASSPYSRKFRCSSTIFEATFNTVSLRLARLLINQRASCRWLLRHRLSSLRSARRISLA